MLICAAAPTSMGDTPHHQEGVFSELAGYVWNIAKCGVEGAEDSFSWPRFSAIERKYL